jgi:hypothetical protein
MFFRVAASHRTSWSGTCISLPLSCTLAISTIFSATRIQFQARDFVEDIKYKPTRSDAAISTFQKLRDQVLHLGKSRPIEGPQKAQLSECEVVARWIEQNLLEFIGTLEEPYASKWTWPAVSQ